MGRCEAHEIALEALPVVELLERLALPGEVVLELVAYDRRHELVLAREVAVELTLGGRCRGEHVVDARGVDAPLMEEARGGE